MPITAAKNGDTVTVHYTGKLTDGTQFDSSAGREPLQCTLGAGGLIPGFENALIGMVPGEAKTVTIACAHAYGQYRKELEISIPRKEFPATIEPKIGQKLHAQQNGQTLMVTVTHACDTCVTLDANHPLAGKDLIFDITLVQIGKEPAP